MSSKLLDIKSSCHLSLGEYLKYNSKSSGQPNKSLISLLSKDILSKGELKYSARICLLGLTRNKLGNKKNEKGCGRIIVLFFVCLAST